MEKISEYFSEWFANMLAQFRAIGPADIVDIVLLSLVFFLAYRFIRDRRAGKLAVGVFLIILLLAVSELFELYAIRFLLQNIFQVGFIALLILFQPELRAALEKMGGEPLRSIKSIGDQKKMAQINSSLDEICDAVSDMARKKTGALIVIERSTKLGDIIRSGVVVDAAVNDYMIRNIFFNKAPLHDGAMIIRDWRICAAGCFLPLTQNDSISKELGTRHRAAIGLSEVSDALIIVVSEERGTISLAREGKLTQGYNYQTLKQELLSQLTTKESQKRIRPKHRGKADNDNGEAQKQ